MSEMSITGRRINDLILDQLSRREMRVLSLVVAIRKNFGQSEGLKGDLMTSVTSALRKLVASKAVVDEGGVYTLVAGPSARLAPATLPGKSRTRLGHA
jgi:hypothetical protein